MKLPTKRPHFPTNAESLANVRIQVQTLAELHSIRLILLDLLNEGKAETVKKENSSFFGNRVEAYAEEVIEALRVD
jgi:hypothetical protein